MRPVPEREMSALDGSRDQASRTVAWDQKAITAHLVDVETGQRLEFQHNPNDILDEKSTAYAAIKIPGLSHPRYQYVSGEPRKISFQLVFFKGPVKESVDWLRSLLYPAHEGTRFKMAPHKVLFLFGDLYPGVVCVVRQARARFFHLFDRDTLRPQHAEVDVLLEEYIEESVPYQEVRG